MSARLRLYLALVNAVLIIVQIAALQRQIDRDADERRRAPHATP